MQSSPRLAAVFTPGAQRRRFPLISGRGVSTAGRSETAVTVRQRGHARTSGPFMVLCGIARAIGWRRTARTSSTTPTAWLKRSVHSLLVVVDDGTRGSSTMVEGGARASRTQCFGRADKPGPRTLPQGWSGRLFSWATGTPSRGCPGSNPTTAPLGLLSCDCTVESQDLFGAHNCCV